MNTNPNSSLYPWSQRRLTYTTSHPSPFPRYGAAVNSVASKEGDIYLMGGLINSSTVKGDLWMVEAGGNMACYPLATTAEGPGPRVGHASLLVGNAFIVYGGDTKMDDSDVLDETLYLLNTCGLTPAKGVNCANKTSYTAVVKSGTCRPSTVWKIWTFIEYSWIQNLRLWRSSRRLFYERLGCVRPEPTTSTNKSMGDAYSQQ
jgi:hypothetical protein